MWENVVIRRLLFLIGLSLSLNLIILIQSSSAFVSPSPASSYKEGEVLVRFRTGVSEDVIKGLHGPIGQEVRIIQRLGMRLVRLNPGVSVSDALTMYKNNLSVEYAQPNYIYRASLFPNDPYFSSLWGLHNTGQSVNGTAGTPDADIDAVEAWDKTTGTRDVIIAVIDSGVAYNHPDLRDNVWTNLLDISGNGIDDDGNGYIDDINGWDFYQEDNDPMDEYGHGTYVAGIIGAKGGNGTGVTGVMWDVELMPLRFMNASGYGTTVDVVEAILYAAVNGAGIINASWGGGPFDQALSDAIDLTRQSGVLFIAAAGNNSSDNDNTAYYPANFSLSHLNVIAVAATDPDDRLAYFSNYGRTSVNVAAPGLNVYSTTVNGASEYKYASGTSAAAPHVAGLAGLLWGFDPSLSYLDVKDAILGGVDSISFLQGKVSTGGRINAAASLQLLDIDSDNILNTSDNCPSVANYDQIDTDLDGSGNVCDPDDDNDGYSDSAESTSGSDPLNADSIPEVCDGLDNDLDGLIDDGVMNTYYLDADADLYGNTAITIQACMAPVNYVSDNTDCDDNNALINPGASEISGDGIDQDCTGADLIPGMRMDGSVSGDQRFPWVDYNESTGEYLVLWQDKRNGANDDIYGVRLDADGNRISADFAVSAAAGHQQRMLVKAGGGGYLALWHDLRNQGTNGADIYGTWIDGTGVVGPEMAICACAKDQWNPVAGYDPVSNTFLVVFLSGTGSGTGNDAFDLWGAMISAGGATSVTPFAMITEPGGQRGPQIGYDYGNSRYYMSWNDRRGGVNYDIYGSSVSTAGTLLNGTGILLSGAAGNQFRPTVTDRRPATGVNNYLIAWTDYRNGSQSDVYGIYVDGNGAAVGSDFAISTNAADQANVVMDIDWINTNKSLISFIDKRNGVDYDIYGATVDQSGTVAGDTVVMGLPTGASGEQRAEVVTYATDGLNDLGFLTVWMDKRNGIDYDIYGIKLWP